MKKGLGKGLDALFSIYNDEEEKTEINHNEPLNQNTVRDGVVEVDIKSIDPNKNQPRKSFDSNSLKELAESIKQHGVIQPIILNDEHNGRFTIIAGERRFRASLIAGKTTIPSVIRSYTQKQVKEIALVENLQREDLNPIEAAKAIKQLMEEYDFTQETVADRIGKSRPLVANTLRLLTLAPEVVLMIEKNLISAGHGKCLVSVYDRTKQIEIANIVIQKKLTVRDLEKLIKEYSSPNYEIKNKASKQVQSLELKELNHRMQRLFKTKVSINGNDKKGKITIDYFNKDDLDRIVSYIESLERNI